MIQRLMTTALFLAIAAELPAGSVTVRDFGMIPLARPDAHESTINTPRDRVASDSVTSMAGGEPGLLDVYPVAGKVGGDLAVPYYVDLDATDGRVRDWACADLAFDGHTGHDPYIRSFTEQRIGVPVFAARDGLVIDVRDGEPDENTSNLGEARANYITIRHDEDETTQYVHLRKGAMVNVGDRVTAGTQIAWVGSSGLSTAPHIHFEYRHAGQVIEPMAGPCRAGAPLFLVQPPTAAEPMVLGAAFTNRPLNEFRSAPFDDYPHTGTFVRGNQTIYFIAEVANVGLTTNYELMLDKPGTARVETAAAGTLVAYDASINAIWWGLNLDLDRTGEWALVLEVNGRRLFTMPFTVVDSPAEIRNRPPAPISASIEPVALRAGQVPVCRASVDLVADPDYDTVRYRYEWKVDGVVVRDVTTAAQSDAIGRQYSRPGKNISCSITASDGVLSTQTVSAFAVPGAVRRRSVGK